MRLHAYCMTCHRMKRCYVSPSQLAQAQAQGQALTGECDDCRDKREGRSS